MVSRDDGAVRVDGHAVLVERRGPVGGLVLRAIAGRPGPFERRERREGIGRDVADVAVVVRRPGPPWEHDRVVGIAVAEPAERDEGALVVCNAPLRGAVRPARAVPASTATVARAASAS